MRVIFFLYFLLIAANAFSQKDIELFQNDTHGRPLYLTVSTPVEGSPYFMDNYIPAEVTVIGGAVYKNVKVKINLVEHLVQYLKPDGAEMITELPVQKVKLEGGFDLESFTGPLNSRDAVIYLVLDSGRISLLKRINASYRDDRQYNAASTTRIFERKETLCYRAQDGQIKKLEKSKGAILELLSDKKNEVSSFIDERHLACKTESDFLQLFLYYNSL